MKNPKLRMLNYALAICGALLTAALYPSLPEQISLNWDLYGNASYSGKGNIFLLCGAAALLAVLFDVLPHIDPRQQNYQKFGAYYDGFCAGMQLFMLILEAVILMEAFRPGTLSVPVATMIAVGVLFLFLGNIMPKIKSNFYMGIKNPWTLSSEEVWRKTHRLGGKCFCLSGLFLIVSAFLSPGPLTFWGTMACVLLIVVVTSVMSWLWWRQEQKA